MKAPSFLKSFFYIIKKKPSFLKFFFKKPSLLLKIFTIPFITPYKLKDNIYYFNVKSPLQLKNSTFLISFAYCQKHPLCKMRFSEKCSHCKKCPLGTWIKKLKKSHEVHIVTTAALFGEKILNFFFKNPKKTLSFITIACPYSIQMFQYIPYLLGIKGAAFPLTKNTCKNFSSFKKAENGLKKDQTFLEEENFKNFLSSLEIFL